MMMISILRFLQMEQMDVNVESAWFQPRIPATNQTSITSICLGMFPHTGHTSCSFSILEKIGSFPEIRLYTPVKISSIKKRDCPPKKKT